jgi:hypothetical protein
MTLHAQLLLHEEDFIEEAILFTFNILCKRGQILNDPYITTTGITESELRIKAKLSLCLAKHHAMKT